MIFNEPPRSQYDLNFRLLGIPVRVHPFFWLAALFLGMSGSPKPIDMVIWIAAVFASILIHELGHALAARSFGWEPWITLHTFGGLASYQPTRRSPGSEILITLAGPGAGFLFAAIIVGFIAASGHHPTFDPSVDVFFPLRFEGYQSMQANRLVVDLMFINVFWGLVNLLPIFPLDGGHIARELLGLANPRDGLRQSLWLSVIASAVMAVLAFTKMDSLYTTIFFVYLAYTNFQTLQANFGPGGGLGG